jgi:hypothetical protein
MAVADKLEVGNILLKKNIDLWNLRKKISKMQNTKNLSSLL